MGAMPMAKLVRELCAYSIQGRWLLQAEGLLVMTVQGGLQILVGVLHLLTGLWMGPREEAG